jgi:hypothetical protein
MIRIVFQFLQEERIGGIGQFINIDNGYSFFFEPMKDKIPTDKTGSASDDTIIQHKNVLPLPPLLVQ